MSTPAKRPNVIWIFGDQHRAQATGYAGDPNLHTPHLDRLAAEGIVFDAVSTCPLCCPARGTLLTSLYPHECVPAHQAPLPQEQPTIAHVLRESGYHTAYFGKWHLDGGSEATGRMALHVVPAERRGGFDFWLGYENNNSPWDAYVHGNGKPEPELLPGYETTELTTLLIEHLRERQAKPETAEQPFFAALSVQPPHDPYVAPAEFMGRHTPADVELRANVPPIERVVKQARQELAGYYGAVEALDWNLGRLRTALEELGLDRDTLIVFFSDHGDMLGSHGQFRKTSPFEESVRVPFIIGGGVPYYSVGRSSNGHLMSLVDVAPTTLGLCGVEKPNWMRGYDFSGLRRREPLENAPDSALLQLVVPTKHGHSTDRPWRALVTRDGWKYAVLEGQPWLMFNLNEDPYELANLAHNTAFGHQRQKLQDRLEAWINEVGDEFALPQI